MKRILTVTGLMLTIYGGSAYSETSPKPVKLALCAGCHGADGRSADPRYPVLAGQHKEYLIKQLQDFRSGKRSDPTMGAMAKALTEAEVAELAAYYADQ